MFNNKITFIAISLLTSLLAQLSTIVTAAEQEKIVVVKEQTDGSIVVDIYDSPGLSIDPSLLLDSYSFSKSSDYAVKVQVTDTKATQEPSYITILESSTLGSSGTDDNNDSGLHPFVAQTMELVNQERLRHGQSSLKPNEALIAAAQFHSEDMAKNGFLSHQGSDGSSPWQRMRDAGYNYRRAGENVAAGYPDPKSVVNAWMNSSGHRANILNSNFCEMGVGYAQSQSKYQHYWTLDFGCR